MSVPCQVCPASMASSSQKVRIENGVAAGRAPSGPSARRLPWSPATTAVTRSVVSVPEGEASQFCTSTQ